MTTPTRSARAPARAPARAGSGTAATTPAGGPVTLASRPVPPAAPPAPPWRDPWLAATLLSVLPLLLHSWKAPLGEPFADDYDFLHRALLEPHRSLFDGGGALIYWRPLSRQVYYALLGPLMLSHPRAVALLHAALLALAAALLYRALRPRWSGPAAAAAATFPLLAESSRTLLLWPSTFQDLGALLFSALALHEASRRRLGTALAALLAGLLCKEITVVAALLLPWLPGDALGTRRERLRWLAGVGVVLALWGGAYALVMRHAGLLFQRHLEASTPPLPLRLGWALGHSLQDGFSLGALPPGAALAGAAAALVLLVAGIVAGLRARGRGAIAGRLAASPVGWIAWGAAWFVLSTATLGETYPLWGPFRGAVGLAGLGIACATTFGAAGPGWLAALVTLRLATFAAAPGPPPAIGQAPPTEGEYDFVTLSRLQRLSAETRSILKRAYPTLPRGATVGRFHRPLMAEHAFTHGKALQVWYRDTTLQWVEWKDIAAHPDRELDAVLEYEPHARRQIGLVTPAAMHEYVESFLEGADFRAALARLARADSLQQDRGALVFLGTLAGKRALCLMGLNDAPGAQRAAEQGLALWTDAADSRYVLATLLAVEGHRSEAMAQLDTLLARYPYDESARLMLDSLRALGTR